MNRKGILRGLIILVILVVDIGLDQLSKIYVRKHFNFYEVLYPFKSEHFQLVRTENTGAFLSLGDSLGNPWRFILLTLLPAGVLLFGLLYVLLKNNLNKLNALGIVLVLAGGFGNLYDRWVYHSVTDFMFIKFSWAQTGVFNVADMSIMAGVGILLVQSFLKDRQIKNQKQAGNGEKVEA